MTIEVEQVTRHVGTTAVLNGLTLDISTDTCYLITGAKGSGKTTLLRILMGLEQPDEGRIRLLGDYKYSWLACGAVFQEDALIEHLSAVKNVSAVRKLTGDKTARAELLALLPADRLELPAHQLSASERRAVSIVRALSVPSDLILMDEPFRGMTKEERLASVHYILDRKGSTPLVIASREEHEELKTFRHVSLTPSSST